MSRPAGRLHGCAVDLDVRRRGGRASIGAWPIPWHPCAESWDTSGQSAPRRRRRRAAPAGVPRLRLGRRRGARRRRAGDRASRPASWPTSRRRWPTAPLPRGARPASGTPAGPPTARPPTATPTRTSTARGAVAVIHNGIIENFAELRAELEERGHELASETDTEVVAHLLAEAYAPAGPATSPRRCGGSAGGSRAPSPCVAVHADAPGRGRRRPPQLAAGGRASARARTSSPPTWPPSSPTPATRSSSARTRSSSSRRDGVDGHRLRRRPGRGHGRTTSTGTPPPPRRAATTTSCSRRSPSSRRRSPTPCWAGSTTTAGCAWTRCGCPTTDLREVDKIVIVACGTAYHAGLVAKYAIEHWTRIPCEVELASEFRYRDPILDPHDAGHRDLPVRRDHGHPDGAAARPRAGREVLAICNTNGSTIPRESDAVLYTHAGPEVAVASTKAFLTQIVACYLVGALPRAGPRHQVRRRDRRRRRRAARRCRPRWTQVLDDHGAGARAGPRARRRARRCCSSAGTSATRWRWRARSSSRSSPTCTPRASPPASSSTGRSR